MGGWHAIHDMRNKPITIRSRRGEGYLLFAVLFTPFIIALMSLALDGLGLAVTYRRAVGLATVAAQAGAGAIAFNGGAPSLRSDACAIALSMVDANTDGTAQSTCQANTNRVEVTVSLRPIRVLAGPLTMPIQQVQVTVAASPAYGINQQEN